MRRTMPQLIMLTHASDVSRRRLEAKSGQRSSGSSPRTEPAVWNGKPVRDLSSAEYLAYHASGGQ